MHEDHIIHTQLGDNPVTLLGTAHVSRASAEEVEQRINSGEYDVVALELCPNRLQAMQDPNALAQMDLMQIIRQGKAAMVSANLALSAYQQRIAEQYGIEPGAEMRAGIEGAKQHNLPLVTIDRDIGLTLKRTAHRLPWWKRWGLFSGLLLSLVSREEVAEDEVEQLKQGDMLENTLAEFAQNRGELYQPLIAERDQYMAAKLQQTAQEHPGKSILAVVGAGHLPGMQKALQEIQDPAQVIEALEQKPPKSKLPQILPWLIVALVLVGFTIGFQRSPEIGWQLVMDWVLINGGLSALGALIATAHPLTIITAFVAAPLTSLNPAVGAGMVTATVELILRKPTVADFGNLRKDVTHFSHWWRNRVSRTLLVFLFSTLGSAAGTYLAGFKIIERLSS
jgi:pheromone shutdown-related protein TraB